MRQPVPPRGSPGSPVVGAAQTLARELLASDALRGLAAESDPAGRLLHLVRRTLLEALLSLPGRPGEEPSLDPERVRSLVEPLAGRDPGDVYQELLGLHAWLGPGRLSVELVRVPGSTRKTSGSYYTPACLIERLLQSALDPVIAEALARPDPESALLGLRVCDPACGDGRFLLAVGRRLARALAQVRGEAETSCLSVVLSGCLFGVDRDPLAVELCRFALRREGADVTSTTEHVRCGNSLVGAIAPQGQEDLDAWTASHLAGPGADVERLWAAHGFFHWPLAFPRGFDVVLGNPPWERVKFQEKEWLASHGDRTGMEEGRSRAEQLSRFLRRSGRFPLGARGDLNHYGPFIETARRLVRPGGRVGLVVPSGLATDDSMKELFQTLLREGLVSWYDFHNRGGLFPGVQGNVKFGLLTLGPRGGKTFRAAAQLSDPAELDEPGRVYELTPEQVRLVNPNTLHCPAFATADDAALVTRLHERFDVLVRDGGRHLWGVRPWTMFHMTKDAPLFRREESLRAEGWALEGNVFRRGVERLLPLYEAKLIGPFTHRAATFAGVPASVRFRTHARTYPLTGPGESALPRYWVREEEVRRRAGEALWFLGFRNAISAVADSRSLVAAILPRAGVGNSLPLLAVPGARHACLLVALLNSFVLDYVLRQKASGGNLNFHVLKQLPVPAPQAFDRPCPWSPGETLADWFVRRVLELTCTTEELTDFASECDHEGPPFVPDEERRRLIRAELDAACFHVYGLARPEVEQVLKSFAILERRERTRLGCFRTAEQISTLLQRWGQPGS